MDKAQAQSRRKRGKQTYEISYIYTDFEKTERQKRIDDAFDFLFDEMESEIERNDIVNEYENRIPIG